MTSHLKITDMTCQNCVRHVREALQKVPGVESATVNLETADAQVTGSAFDTSALIQAVERAGYGAQLSPA